MESQHVQSTPRSITIASAHEQTAIEQGSQEESLADRLLRRVWFGSQKRNEIRSIFEYKVNYGPRAGTLAYPYVDWRRT